MYTNSINRGITFLSQEQQEHGNFLSLSSSSVRNFSKALTLHPLFPTALIFSCLVSVKETEDVKQLKERAAAFLLSQKSDYWSFNYWIRGSEETKTMPYPDDLDDTFYTLAALFHHNPRMLEGKALACIVSILTSLEVAEGGPYRTWLVTEDAPDKWKDVDLAVNSNIGYFLSLLEIDIPNLNTFIAKAIAENTLSSPYYHTDYPIIYFISRFYKGKYVKKLRDILMQRRSKTGSFGNLLHTALAVSALLNLGVAPRQLRQELTYITGCQKKEGSWEPYGFYIDPTRDGNKHYAGSKALTTAFCVQALALSLQVLDKQHAKKRQQQNQLPHNILHAAITATTQKTFSDISQEMDMQANTILTKLLHNDHEKQITLLPYFVKKSLGNRGKDIPDDLIERLGKASLLGWAAYTIYDNFLDEEGDPKTLSVATCALRELTRLFSSAMPKESGFETFFHEIMNKLDDANAWEAANCRIANINKPLHLASISLPDFGGYERLANRSLGHALSPLAVLFSLGYDRNSPEIKNFLTFFTHYIIAKQLLDDAHDFEQDFRKGHITPVVALIIKTLRKDHKTISLKDSSALINQIFWHEVVTDICAEILTHAKLARAAIRNVPPIEDRTLFESIIKTVEASAKKALTERKKAIKFLKSYQK